MTHAEQGISSELFTELLELWRKQQGTFGEGAIAGPFVPMVGKRYGEPGSPRLMFVGKATYGWDEPPELSLEACAILTHAHCKQVSNGGYRSAFWRFLDRMTRRMHSAAGCDSSNSPEWALDRLVWSNLFKIGAAKSQPGKALARAQYDLMARLLTYEMESLRPDAIILMTGDYEGDFVERALGTECKHKLSGVAEPWTDVIEIPSINARLYWTRHPQGWSNPEPEEAAICRDFGDFFRCKQPKG